MTTRKVLFLDIDGVLHRGIARRSGNLVVSSAPGFIELFEFAPVLDELLRPYPDVEIVLSSDWAIVLGTQYTVAALPLSTLRERVVGATYEDSIFNEYFWFVVPRGAQVMDYVSRNSPLTWLAVDDREDGFESHRDRLVHCQTDAGLGDPVVVELFRQRLQQFFSGGSTDDINE
ncbi:HAD domain-containing protein [Paraburkholderia sp. CNPSo 3272]|uniref:HAD domain-containing protein n=1 Tax=Paraburkholderia sp. CNPSo 3272 TaxID=2940931 RepID=UPI0020B66F0C|nr:HAD domain-containing protein [Paraburkholderia sp. CNPSo 3272]MCP3722606.1 HAD domain-containing protein [Paraburkholderia sp. CNPSo 3272]